MKKMIIKYFGLVSVMMWVAVKTAMACPTTPGSFILNSPSSSSIYGTSVNLSWGTSSNANAGYVIYYKTVSGSWTSGGTSGTTSGSVSGLSYGTTYNIKVTATNLCFTGGTEPIDVYTSKDSNTITITTEPQAPTAYSASSIGTSSFTASWTSRTGATSYKLDVSTSNTFTAGTFVSGFQGVTVTSTSKSVTGLSSATRYYYRVRSVNGSGESSNSSTKNMYTKPESPNLSSTTGNSQSSFTVNWSAVTRADSYRLDVSTNSSFIGFVSGYQNLTVAGTSQTVSGLTAGTTYYYRVRAYDTAGASTSSNSGTGSTLTFPADPNENDASDIDLAQFSANWDAVTSATSYRLDVSTTNDFSTRLTGYDDLTVNGTTERVSGLNSVTTYYYRVRAVNGSGTSGNSGTTSVTTLLGVPVVNNPSNHTSTSFTVSWGAVTNADSYRLDVSTHPLFSGFVTGYENLSVSGTSKSVTGLSAGTTYYIRVRAYDVETTSTSADSDLKATITAPSAPTIAGVSSNTQTSFSVNWGSVSTSTGYRLDLSTQADFSTFVSGYEDLAVSGTSKNVSGLNSATQYYARIRAYNTSGTSGHSGPYSNYTLPDVPTLSNASAISQNSFTASWTASSRAESYRLDVATDASFTSFVAGYEDLTVNGTSQAVTGLNAGTVYYFRVRAHDTDGNNTSASSSAESTVTIPADPTANSATGETTSAFTANWGAISGSTGYELYVSTQADFSTAVSGYNNLSVATTTKEVTGLISATRYYYRVRAVNASGASGYSNASNTYTIPNAPALNNASAIAQTSFTASWSAPNNADSYRLDVATDASFTSFVTGYEDLTVNGTSQSVTGLNTGTVYYFRVRAYDVEGGNISDNSASKNTRTIPANPTANSATGETTSTFTANWVAVSGSTGYELYVSTQADFSTAVSGYNNLSVATTTKEVTGLNSATRYYYRVRAVNASGASGYSNASNTYTIPNAPALNNASAIAQTSFTASWSAANNADSYRLDVATDASFTSFLAGYEDLTVNGTSQSVTGLNTGTVYYFRVRAYDVEGGNISGNSASKNTRTIPANPTANSATGETTSTFTANWGAVSGNTGYELYVSTQPDFSTVVSGYNNLSVAATTKEVTGLNSATRYYYRVRSVNASGASGYSNATNTYTIPNAPVLNNASAISQTSFTASWSAPNNADSYRLDVATDASFTSFVTGYEDLTVNGTSQSVTGLNTGMVYYFRVRAFDVEGGNISGNSSSKNTRTIPANPTANSATGETTAAFTANWGAVSGSTGYELQVSTQSDFSSTVSGYNNLSVATTTKEVTGLNSATRYYYRVRSVNASGASSYSNAINTFTIPETPVLDNASSVSQTSFSVSWNSISNADYYLLDVSKQANFSTFVTGYQNLTVTGTSKNVSNIAAGTTYYFRVRAHDTEGGNTTVSSTPKSTLTIPANPVATDATGMTESSFTASWGAVNGSIGYRLDVSTVSDFATFLTGYENLTVNGTSLEITNLGSATHYYYRVRAINAAGTSNHSNIIDAYTIPAIPTLNNASNVGQTSFVASWSAVSNADSYKLDVSTNAIFSAYVTGYQNLVVNGTSKTVNGLNVNTTYYFRVRAYDAEGGNTSSSSDYKSVLTKPANPVAVLANNITQTSFSANWNAVTGANSYRIDVSTASDFSSYIAGYQNLNVGAVTTKSITGLPNGVTYYYRVRSVNNSGASNHSNTVSLITIPGEPVSLSGNSIAQDGFTARWNSQTGASDYLLDISEESDFSTFLAGYEDKSITGTEHAVSTLASGKIYYYRVSAVNGSGKSGYSETVEVLTLPPTPLAESATAMTTEGLTASWTAVTSATGYLFDLSTESDFSAFVSGYENVSVAGATKSITGLDAGVQYFYRVRAVNASGNSEYSNVINDYTIPDAPVLNAATNIGQTSFTISWTAVDQVENYRLDVSESATFSTYITGYQNLVVSSTSHEVTGLNENQKYYFRVRSRDTDGGNTSANSETKNTTTLTADPVATDASSVAQTTFTANWNAVPGATAYRLDVSTNSDFSSFVTGYENLSINTTSQDVSGLSTGITYYYQVRSENGSGVSNNSNTIALMTIPGEPNSLDASDWTQDSFSAQWDAETGATGYLLDVSESNDFSSFVSGYENLDVSGTSQTVNGLTSGTSYFYRVSAYNGTGASDHSGTIETITVPASPVAASATAKTQTAFTANWDSATGSSGYRLDVSTSSDFSTFLTGYEDLSVSVTSADLSGLNTGTSYFYRVRSENNSGISDHSNTIELITIPSEPSALSATDLAQQSFIAHWESETGATGYLLDVSETSDFATFVSGYENLEVSGTSQAVAGLATGTSYFYRVSAYNESGESGHSGSIETLTIPATPAALAATGIGTNTMTANWDAVSGADNYRFDLSTSSTFSTFVSGYEDLSVVETTQTITGLSSGVHYYYRVRSENASGISGNSSIIDDFTLPDAPILSAASQKTQTSFQVNWSAVSNANNYRLDVSTGSGFGSFVSGYDNLTVYGTSHSVSGLEAGVKYFFRLRAYDSEGENISANSSTKNAITIPADPNATDASAITQSAFTANWDEVVGSTGYRLDVATNGEFTSFLGGYEDLSVTATSLTLSGLESGRQYYYRVRSENSTGISGHSTSIAVLTIADDPVANDVIDQGQHQFTATWNQIFGASSYLLDVSSVQDFSSFESNYHDLEVSGTDHLITGLATGTNYYYRVRSKNSTGNSDYSNTIAVLTIPGNPTAAAATGVETQSFVATWSAETGADQYHLDVATESDFSIVLAEYSNLLVSGTSKSITGLTAGHTYYYRVRAENSSGISGHSNSVEVITKPLAPEILNPTDHSETSFVIHWNPVEGPSEYLIDVSTLSSFNSKVSGYDGRSVSPSLTSLSIDGLTAGTRYFYRIRAKNASGSSANSSTIETITIPEQMAKPELGEGKPTRLRIDWQLVSGVDNYELYVATDENYNELVDGYGPLTVHNQLTSAYVENLSVATPYYVQMRAKNESGYSKFSVTLSTSTTDSDGNFVLALIQNITLNERTNDLSWNVSGGTGGIKTVILYHKTITANEFTAEPMAITNNGEYAITLDDSWMGTLGMQYKIYVEDKVGRPVESEVKTINISLDDVEIQINETFSTSTEDYQIISIPYELSTTRISDLFEGYLGLIYDPGKWRLLRYRDAAAGYVGYKEGLSASHVQRGAGYWFISSEPVSLKFGEGHTPTNTIDEPFELRLKQGWNQIGNPYLEDINWSDVLSVNGDPETVGPLHTYQGSTKSFIQDDLLKVFGGGFVFADQDITLIIPVNINTTPSGGRVNAAGRTVSDGHDDELSLPSGDNQPPYEWQLDFTLTQGQKINQLSGIGMHHSAAHEKDRYDMVSLPAFGKQISMHTTHAEFFYPSFAKDIVRPAQEYYWHFDITGSANEAVELTWSTEQLPDGMLILYDLVTGQLIDMGSINSYSFSRGKQAFRIYYTKTPIDLNVNGQLGQAYPNPMSQETSIPFGFHLGTATSEAVLYVYDLQGTLVTTYFQTEDSQGIRSLSWDGTNKKGERVNPGVYYYKTESITDGISQTSQGKIIVK